MTRGSLPTSSKLSITGLAPHGSSRLPALARPALSLHVSATLLVVGRSIRRSWWRSHTTAEPQTNYDRASMFNGLNVRTIHSLGWAILNEARPGSFAHWRGRRPIPHEPTADHPPAAKRRSNRSLPGGTR